jgi:hypothetical protein
VIEDGSRSLTDRVGESTSHSEECKLLGLFSRIRPHLNHHVDRARNGENSEDRREGSKDKKGILIVHETKISFSSKSELGNTYEMIKLKTARPANPLR